MWIAKPIKALTDDERLAWQLLESELPLAQTLAWGHAAQSLSARAYLVFSPEEKVGGVVLGTPHANGEGIHFECINGPWLDWDNPAVAPRQLATFAMAVSKLDRQFTSLSIKPRWEDWQTQERLQRLPIQAFGETQAATLVVRVQPRQDQQWNSLTSRLRRSIQLAQKNGVETQWERVSSTFLERRVPELSCFASTRGFSVPPLSWFKMLMLQNPTQRSNESPSFWAATSTYKQGTSTQSETCIFVVFQGSRAHYLFGYEKRNPACRAAISTAASAHWEVLIKCADNGMRLYDLNGYVVDSDPLHPYHGVCRFKDQFAGQVIQYRVPEFLIR